LILPRASSLAPLGKTERLAELISGSLVHTSQPYYLAHALWSNNYSDPITWDNSWAWAARPGRPGPKISGWAGLGLAVFRCRQGLDRASRAGPGFCLFGPDSGLIYRPDGRARPDGLRLGILRSGFFRLGPKPSPARVLPRCRTNGCSCGPSLNFMAISRQLMVCPDISCINIFSRDILP
jgi:hypothetical protein